MECNFPFWAQCKTAKYQLQFVQLCAWWRQWRAGAAYLTKMCLQRQSNTFLSLVGPRGLRLVYSSHVGTIISSALHNIRVHISLGLLVVWKNRLEEDAKGLKEHQGSISKITKMWPRSQFVPLIIIIVHKKKFFVAANAFHQPSSECLAKGRCGHKRKSTVLPFNAHWCL